MFLFSFNNSTCTSSRDLTWLCVVIRIHHVLYRIGTSCTNCGVRRPTDGLCARCLDLPYCKVCKRHLENNCFNQVQRKICQVHLQIVYHVTIMRILQTLQIGLLFLPLHVISSVCYRTAKKTHLQTAHSHCAQQRHSRNFVARHSIRHVL